MVAGAARALVHVAAEVVAVRVEHQSRGAELRQRPVDRVGAPKVAGEPEVEHLGALAELGSRRARAVLPRRQAALLSVRADLMCVPARYRTPGSWPVDAARHGEHDTD